VIFEAFVENTAVGIECKNPRLIVGLFGIGNRLRIGNIRNNGFFGSFFPKCYKVAVFSNCVVTAACNVTVSKCEVPLFEVPTDENVSIESCLRNGFTKDVSVEIAGVDTILCRTNHFAAVGIEVHCPILLNGFVGNNGFIGLNGSLFPKCYKVAVFSNCIVAAAYNVTVSKCEVVLFKVPADKLVAFKNSLRNGFTKDIFVEIAGVDTILCRTNHFAAVGIEVHCPILLNGFVGNNGFIGLNGSFFPNCYEGNIFVNCKVGSRIHIKPVVPLFAEPTNEVVAFHCCFGSFFAENINVEVANVHVVSRGTYEFAAISIKGDGVTCCKGSYLDKRKEHAES